MEALINFDALGEAAINLTNKLSNGVGWLANRETPKRLAIETYIKDIQKSDLDPLTKAAFISNSRKIIKEYCNQNDIVKIAISSLQQQAKPEVIDEDWLEKFMDKARLISSEEFKLIWGKILARECNSPGSVPLVLLYTLEKMDKEDAETFSSLARISVKLGKIHAPVIVYKRLEDYRQFGITFDNLLDLSALGLIEMNMEPLSAGYNITTGSVSDKVIYYDKEYELDGQKSVSVGNVVYTKSGEALVQAIEVEEIEGFWEEYCLPFWENKKQI